MPDVYVSKDAAKLLAEEKERAKRLLGLAEYSDGDLIRDLVLEARRLRAEQSRLIQRGAARAADADGPRVF